jgi:hypothetical protein
MKAFFAAIALFMMMIQYVSAEQEIYSVAAGDFNEDGVQDIITGKYGDTGYKLTVRFAFRNDSAKKENLNHLAGWFSSESVLYISEKPDLLVSGDFDADGHQDVATARMHQNSFYWLRGDGKGQFSYADPIFVNSGITGLDTTDSDPRDGKAELLIHTNNNSKTLYKWQPGSEIHADANENESNVPPSKRISLHLNADAVEDFVSISKEKLKIELSSPSAVFIVNDPAETQDANLGDGLCDTNLGTAGDQCTLRAAIEQANVDAAMDAIHFNLPGAGVPTIALTGSLPVIVNPLTIDGTTQAAGKVEIHGLLAGPIVAALNITAGNTMIRGLVLNKFTGNAIKISGGDNNIVEDNYIGTDVTGTMALGNNGAAVLLEDSSNNIIGGTSAAARNVISGNTGFAAIQIRGLSAIDNVISANFIGTDVTGILPLGNSLDAINISSPNNTVGGIPAGSRNLISANSNGIVISGVDATGNLIQGNFVGTDITGTIQLGNSTGIGLLQASGNTIGGTTAAARNLISGNGTGVAISSGGGNFLQGNFIGTDGSGMTAIPNSIAGIIIGSSADNMIGGATAAEGNVISGSVFVGMLLTGSAATGNQIMNNWIGTAADGTTPIGNGLHGIILSNPRGTFPTGNLVQSNTIANNGGDGVYVQGGTSNSVLSNAITNNAGLGIDLGPDGITANDATDPDTGANNLQNFPVLILAESSGGMTTITGLHNSTPNTAFTVEFFHDASCDASGNGEGGAFLGSINVMTDGSGSAALNAVFAILVANGRSISATATDPNGNTSEFSACIIVGGGTVAIFFDDFSDGDASDWTSTKGTWIVMNENLTGTLKKRGDIVSPDFGGCTNCTFTANLGIQTPGGRISLLAWFEDKKTFVEVRLMEDRDKVLLLQKSNGAKVAKASAPFTIDPGVTYNLQITYDGTNFQVFLNGSLILTQAAAAVPSGNAGIRVKSTTGTSTTGFLADIHVE